MPELTGSDLFDARQGQRLIAAVARFPESRDERVARMSRRGARAKRVSVATSGIDGADPHVAALMRATSCRVAPARSWPKPQWQQARQLINHAARGAHGWRLDLPGGAGMLAWGGRSDGGIDAASNVSPDGRRFACRANCRSQTHRQSKSPS